MGNVELPGISTAGRVQSCWGSCSRLRDAELLGRYRKVDPAGGMRPVLSALNATHAQLPAPAVGNREA